MARRPRLMGVDALRGVAALLVVLHHLPALTGPLVVLKPVQAIGWVGVDLFLVLSGFSIHFRWAERGRDGHFEHQRFAKRRFWRLYPTYLAAVALAAVVGLVVGADQPHEQLWRVTAGTAPVWVVLAGQVLLVGANVISTTWVNVSWSLALEIQLYAVYGTFVDRLRRIGVQRLLLASFAVAIVWRTGCEFFTTSVPVGQFKPDGSSSELSRLLYAQVPARWFEWMLGLWAAEAYFGNVRIWRPLRLTSVALVLGALSRPGFDGDLEARIASWQKGMLRTQWPDRRSTQTS